MLELPEIERADWKADAISHWLLQEGRFLPSIADVTHALGQRLIAAGAPLWRLRVAMRTLHPLVAATTATWERDKRFMPPVEHRHGIESRPEYRGSPFETVSLTRASFRRRLDSELTDSDHTALHATKAEGGTDYFAFPLEFTEGAMAIIALSADTEGGFSTRDITEFRRVGSVLAPVAEVFREKRVSSAVAIAYLGARTGRRVLDGQITLGNIEKIDAAILISDIRGWTALNTRVSGEQALALANRYFDIVANAVEDNGGEVLKFIGDSVLAIFPFEDGASQTAADVCRDALAAADQAVIAARESEPALGLIFGVGIHFGEVHYGNIGSKTRMDFTVMGQAVNITARLEGLCKEFDRPILFSEEFARQLDQETIEIAQVRLKGYEQTFKIMCSLETRPAVRQADSPS